MEHNRETEEYQKARDCYVCPYLQGKSKTCQKDICVWDEEKRIENGRKSLRMIEQLPYTEDDCLSCLYHG